MTGGSDSVNKTDGKRFCHELRLKPTTEDARHLHIMLFDMGRKVYNACLAEALRREALYRRLPQYRAATEIYKTDKAEGKRLYKEAVVLSGFSEFSLIRFAHHSVRRAKDHDNMITRYIGSSCANMLASRAYLAVAAWTKKRHKDDWTNGKPDFRRYGESVALDCINVRFDGTHIVFRTDARGGRSKLRRIPALLDPKDLYGIEAHALRAPLKYIRLLSRDLNGHCYYYAQLILVGSPAWKATRGAPNPHGVVGLDMGPRSVAVVCGDTAFFTEYCPGMQQDFAAVRRLQRHMARSLRANNPEWYDAKGRTLKGAKHHLKKSHRYRKLQQDLIRMHRRMTTKKKQMHAALVAMILQLGTTVHTEALRYNAWQRTYGKTMMNQSPGMFLALLKRRAEEVGGRVVEFSTKSTFLSQACHCGRRAKKSLSNRIHRCPCGVGPVHRDLYSAFLAQHVTVSLSGGSALDYASATAHWMGCSHSLQQVSRELVTSKSAGLSWQIPESPGLRAECASAACVPVLCGDGTDENAVRTMQDSAPSLLTIHTATNGHTSRPARRSKRPYSTHGDMQESFSFPIHRTKWGPLDIANAVD